MRPMDPEVGMLSSHTLRVSRGPIAKPFAIPHLGCWSFCVIFFLVVTFIKVSLLYILSLQFVV